MHTVRKPDHGYFRFPQPQADEDAVIERLIREAKKNKVRPGHAWCRIGAEHHGHGKVVKEIHVDLHARLVEVWETTDGVETARVTHDLAEAPS
jgi:hypothetical protein